MSARRLGIAFRFIITLLLPRLGLYSRIKAGTRAGPFLGAPSCVRACVRACEPASDSFLPIVRGTRLFTTLSIIARQWTRVEFLKTRDIGSAGSASRCSFYGLMTRFVAILSVLPTGIVMRHIVRGYKFWIEGIDRAVILLNLWVLTSFSILFLLPFADIWYRLKSFERCFDWVLRVGRELMELCFLILQGIDYQYCDSFEEEWRFIIIQYIYFRTLNIRCSNYNSTVAAVALRWHALNLQPTPDNGVTVFGVIFYFIYLFKLFSFPIISTLRHRCHHKYAVI